MGTKEAKEFIRTLMTRRDMIELGFDIQKVNKVVIYHLSEIMTKEEISILKQELNQ